MAADVHTVAVIAHGARYAADKVLLLEDNRTDVRFRQQLIGGGQSRGTGADDDGRLLRFAPCISSPFPVFLLSFPP